MDPTLSSQNTGLSQESTTSAPTNAPEWQSIQKCHADYNQIPHGWRQSAFMGKCGYKIQARKFYSADTPCYPIQDISCMGTTQKRVWANICATEFPCKSPEPETAKFSSLPVEPSWLTRFINDASRIVNSNVLLLLGVTLGSCLTIGILSHQPTKSEDESDIQSEVHTN